MFNKACSGTLLFSLLTVGAADAAMAQASTAEPSRMEAAYAAKNRVAPSEARGRLQKQRKAGQLRAEIEKNEPDTFAGMYIEHSPSFRVVARFKGDSKATLAKYRTDLEVTPESADLSLRELRQAQDETYKELKDSGIESASSISEKDGTLQFFVLDPSAADDLKKSGKLKHAAKVRFGRAHSLKRQGEAKVEGGRPLAQNGAQVCTSGFTVYKTGLANNATRYILTAGHCPPGALTYLGQSLPIVGENYVARTVYDYQ